MDDPAMQVGGRAVPLRLFGPPEWNDGTTAFAFAPERRFQLLALLALRAGEWVARDEAAALLWPERAMSEARRNLRHVVFKARKAIGGDGLASAVALGDAVLAVDSLNTRGAAELLRGHWPQARQWFERSLQQAGEHGLRRRLYRDPLPPRVLRPDCPPWLQEIILRCLEVHPERHHQTAAQLAFDLQNPDQVALTARAERLVRSGTLTVLKRWFGTLGTQGATPGSAGEQAGRHPILLAAVDIAGAEPALLDAVRATVQRLLQTEPGARLACLTVMKLNRVAMDELTDVDGGSRHLNLLVQLKHWARPVVKALDLLRDDQAGRVTFHVLEAPDAADAIVEYARRNQVDHIVMGARSSGGLRRYLGSVSAEVVTQSDCTVTVVRAAAPAE